MKKQLLIGSVLFAAISAFSQSGKIKLLNSSLINTKILANAKFESNESTPLAGQTGSHAASLNTEGASKTNSISNTWNNFTASMNIYGSVISFCKPLQWNDELNAVSFIHRKSNSYTATGTTANSASGAIVAMISRDCGASWDSTLVYADATNRGRYPQGAIYNPPSVPSNTNINNAYIVSCGPITLGSGWVGNFYASKQLGQVNYDNIASSTPNAMQYFSSTAPYPVNLGRHDFSAYGFTATDDGKMRSLAGVTDPSIGTAGADTAIMLVTGTFNAGVFNWAGTVFNPPTTVDGTDGSENLLSRPMMAWNEAGTHGYVVIIGARIGTTGSNVGYQPIVYKTTNSGSTWSLESGIDFNSVAFKDVKRSIITVASDSTLEVPFFWYAEGMDCAVDANNKLHIFSSVIGSASNHPDSLGYIRGFTSEGYRFPHQPGFRPYLYDFIYDGATSSWSHITVDSMSTEGPSASSTGNGYQDNPWDPDPAASNQKVRIDARLQMSRTPDGKYIVYTWAESDSTVTTQQKKWNSLPNVKARLLNVTTGLVHPVELNITKYANGISGLGNGNVADRAMYHFISPKCRVASTLTANGPAITMPITVSNSYPYSQLSGNSHWISWAVLNFGNVSECDIKMCSPVLTSPCVSINENVLNGTNSSLVFPNPTKNNATLTINLVNSTKVHVEVMNTVGQIVKSTKVDAAAGVNSINIELSGLASGIYLINVKVDHASSTKKLIIE